MKNNTLRCAFLFSCLISHPSAFAEGDIQSKYLAVAFSRNVPAFDRFLVDSLGHGKLSENPLLPVTNQLAGISFDGKAYCVNGKAIWSVAVSEKALTLSSTFAEGVAVEPFTLAFDQKKNHATLLGLMKPGERKMAMPCILHLPDMGTLRITCNVPGAMLDYDARRFVKPACVRIGFPSATAATPRVEYRLEVV